MTDSWISALSFSSFAAPVTPGGEPAATDKRGDTEDIAMRWQSHSGRGAAAALASVELQKQAGQEGFGLLLNRVVEIHGLAGSIGEQLSLAWAAEQDAQRFQSPDIERDPRYSAELDFTQRMAVRALCEMSTHFLLGAAHSLANLVLRVVICHSGAATVVNAEKRNRSARGFLPDSELKSAWPTFAQGGELWSKTLPAAAERSGLVPLSFLVDRLVDLQQDARFGELEQRRGMDYHRQRPQSLDHASPRSGVWSYDPVAKASRIAVPSANSDGRGDEAIVHKICVDALECVAGALRDTEPLIASALQSCHLAWRPDATRLL